jgi:hypothetical protein
MTKTVPHLDSYTLLNLTEQALFKAMYAYSFLTVLAEWETSL